MSIIQGNAHTSTGGYQIERSLRFNSADSAYLNRTPASDTSSNKKGTFSCWMKVSSNSGTNGGTFLGAADNYHYGQFYSESLYFGNSTSYINTAAVFRDFSAWYHVFFVFDTTLATANDRMQIWVNGVRQAVGSFNTQPTQNASFVFLNTAQRYDIGRRNTGNHFNGYLTEVNFIDGQALTPSSFGETDSNTGVWKPKAYSGTYGTNGFYLKFADNSGTTATTLGKDSSGNGNNWTPNNFSVGLASSKVLVIDDATKAGSVTKSMTIVGSGTVNLTAFGGCGNISGSVFTGIGSLNGLISDWQTHTVYKNGSSLFTVQGGAVNNNSGSQTATQSRTAQTVTQNNVAVSNGDVISIAFGANNAVTSYYGYPGGAPSLTVTANSGVSISDYSTTDSFVDTPTSYGTDTGVGGEVRGNYCTLNPLKNEMTLSNGNLALSGGTDTTTTATMAIPSSGKWYFEFVPTGMPTSNANIGLASEQFAITNATFTYAEHRVYIQSGNKANGSGSAAYGASWTTADVIGVAVDMDAGTLVFYKNNSSQGTAFSDLVSSSKTWFPLAANYGSGTFAGDFNFGQRPFAYTAPSGFKALCTQNLSTPTIGATSTTLANKYFDAKIYTGNGSALTITTGFPVNFSWQKGRSAAQGHFLQDTVRGISAGALRTYDTGAEGGVLVTSFDSDGVTFNANGNTNTLNNTYVAWLWRANGAGVTNTAGTITSTVSANTTSGFSIITYTGNGTNGATIGHGLGVVPKMFITKNRNGYNSSGGFNDWSVYHVNCPVYTGGAAIDGTARQPLWLHSTAGASNGVGGFPKGPTSTVFTPNQTAYDNASGQTYVAYCFAEVAGFSSFGSYTGNGSADGPFIYTGFRPRYVLVKRTDSTGWWHIWDSARNTYNLANLVLFPNGSDAESTYTAPDPVIDILSNGFKNRGNYPHVNASGGTYIYAAFAESPFKYSLAR